MAPDSDRRPRFCIVIPSAARKDVDYLAETLADFADKLAPEVDQLESLIVYNPDDGSTRRHRGFEAATEALHRGDYGTVGEKIRLCTPLDLTEERFAEHQITREPLSARQCHDFAHALSFARASSADFVVLFEDDVRLTRNFLAKTIAVAQVAERRSP